jgi:hypothetical protein
MQEIESYQLAWHPQRGGAFRFKLAGVQNWSPWTKLSSADLAAVAAVLNEKPVYFNSQTGVIHTGAEPTGE